VTCSPAPSMVKSSAVKPLFAAAWWLTTPATGPVSVMPLLMPGADQQMRVDVSGIDQVLCGQTVRMESSLHLTRGGSDTPADILDSEGVRFGRHGAAPDARLRTHELQRLLA
jgi:hypothetical protein